MNQKTAGPMSETDAGTRVPVSEGSPPSTAVTGIALQSGASRRGDRAPSKILSAIRPIPRRGLSREEAAMYIGISATKFDELVRDGKMPRPKRIDGRKVWDLHQLDLAFDDLPSDGNTWDDV
jgi:predicted DNA-binding transcriptional regulator AlpA